MTKITTLFFQFVFLPECCDYVGSNVPETLKLSETIDGDTMLFYRNLSKTNKMWLSIGGFHEKVPKIVSLVTLATYLTLTLTQKMHLKYIFSHRVDH